MNIFAALGVVTILGWVFLNLIDLIKFLIKNHKC